MQFTNLYTTEFLAELNLILTQEDYGNKLYDLLTPIKNLLQKENELLTYSLARYCGANSRLAFMCEWYLLTKQLILDNSRLIEEDKKHLLKKINPKFKKLKNLEELVEADILTTFLPLQMSFLNLKTKEFIDEQLIKYPYLHKYLNSGFLSQFTTSELQLHKSLYLDSISLNQYIDIQGIRTSFVYICLPCLVGFSYSFNQDDHIVNPKGIKWNQLENIFKQIASLHQMIDDKTFTRVVYEASLDEEQEIMWLEMEDGLKEQISTQNDAALDVIQMLREKIFDKVKKDIDSIVFPEKFKTMIADLAKWAYDQKTAQING